MSVKAIHLKRGMGIHYKSGVWIVQDNQKVAKGNWRSSQVIQLRNVATGMLIEERFRTEEEFEQAITERKTMNYLYTAAAAHVFMDMESFEEFHVPLDTVGDQAVFLQPNLEVTIGIVEGKPVFVDLPTTVELVIKDTPPEIKGATATHQLKDAVCEGGARIKVPPFITSGERVKVDTRTGQYLSRA